MRTITVLLALALTAAVAAQGRKNFIFPPAWGDKDIKASMEAAGWQFRTTLGLPERLCYAVPPGKNFPDSPDWADALIRADAVAHGALRFPSRADGKCYAGDAHG